MSEKPEEFEAEVKIRRNGRLIRWEKALGDSPLFALTSAVNDLERDLQHEAAERALAEDLDHALPEGSPERE